MIVLDTNVLSEIIRTAPEPHVAQWLEEQSVNMLFTTTITRAELLYGACLLPDGKRKSLTIKAISEIFMVELHDKVLSFDNDAAQSYAEIAASRRSAGKPISQFDAMIAAITKSRGAKLATRNVKDFVDCGIKIINPWEA